MKRRNILVLLTVLAVLVLVGAWHWQRRESAQLETHYLQLQQTRQLIELEKAKHEQLKRQVPDDAEMNHRRAAATALRELRASQAEGRLEVVSLTAMAETVPADAPAFAPRRVSTERIVHDWQWRNVGASTPEAAVETQCWAFKHGDLVLAARTIVLNDDARAKIEAFLQGLPEAERAALGTPELVMARVLAPWLKTLNGFRTTAGAQAEGGVMTVRTVWSFTNGRAREHEVQWQKGPHGWQRIISDPENVLPTRLNGLRTGNASILHARP